MERLEPLERTDPVLNGAKRLNDWNFWNGLSVCLRALVSMGDPAEVPRCDDAWWREVRGIFEKMSLSQKMPRLTYRGSKTSPSPFLRPWTALQNSDGSPKITYPGFPRWQ